MADQTPTPQDILAAPKVLLHDHLDGGLRPTSVIELADEFGYSELPTTDPVELAEWMKRGADRKDLVLYLDTFAHTVGVMQTREALHRVARECAEDLIADGVVYAEVRFAPELHVEQGLTMDDVLEAVTAGFADGSANSPLTIRTICSAMRQNNLSLEVSQVAVRWRDRGVVGFDIAGPEKGFPPDDHVIAFQYAERENFHFTIHAGEAYGPPSIWKALQWCGAERLGHGVRIIDDIEVGNDGELRLGRLAHYIRDRRIPLEVCPSSNLHTGVVDDLADHPIKLFKDLKFRVTLNTDNRLMSDISMTKEMQNMVDVFGWDMLDMQWLTVNAMKSAFLPFDERLVLINEVIKPHYAELRGL
ncbi:MAG: adenosine deaminase [Verrucomicrobiales bacterium]|jgi:adenosine deaminase